MTFDPFGDFETEGYLRNFAQEKDPDTLRRLEHSSFETGLDEALKYLQDKTITYADVLKTHEILFDAVYPWAGQDRAQTASDIAVGKGEVLFAHPADSKQAVDYALQKGNDPKAMAQQPGDVFGNLAYAHPFLDGNGRTLMVVHAVLAHRAGISIDWSATDKTAFLSALTKEIEHPGKGHLDDYLKPFVRTIDPGQDLATEILRAPGLDGRQAQANAVLGKNDEPTVQEKYRLLKIERSQSQSGKGGTESGG